MIDTDKYEIPKYEDAKKVVQDAGLIEENDGHPDIFYRKIAQLLTEVKRLREVQKKIGSLICDECGLSIEEHIRYHTENDVIAGCPFGED